MGLSTTAIIVVIAIAFILYLGCLVSFIRSRVAYFQENKAFDATTPLKIMVTSV